MDETAHQQINTALNIIQKIAAGDFKARIKITGTDEYWDALANGINMLGEEIHAKTKEQQEKNEALLFMLEDLDEEKNKVSESLDMLQKSEQELRKTKEKLESLNNHLEEEVQQRTATISQLLQQKDEFINQLSHDLKTPLGPFKTLLPLLEKNELDPKRKEMFEVLMRNTAFMEKLVHKTIKLAQLNSSQIKLNLIALDLNHEIQKVIQENDFLIKQKHINIDLNIPENTIVQADPIYLQDLCQNLLTNAIKYNHDNGFLFIEAKKEKNVVTISFRDDGIGLSEEQIHQIFKEFYKVDWSRHDFNSSGLGLSIVKKIVEHHGGNIWVESNGENQGSTFYFTLKSE